jgi:hypothetical protein
VAALLPQSALPPPPPPPPPLASAAPLFTEGIAAGGDTPNAEVDPSVASFVPMLPKSMLQLVAQPAQPQLQLTLPAAPLVSAEFVKLARECRRCHVSGFPQSTTKRDLEVYFMSVLRERRRCMVQRQTGQEVKDGVIIDIDRVLDIFIDSAKAHPFAFIELNYEDMAAELVERSEEDIFSFPSHDGSHPLRIRRPKDFRNQTGVDPTKLVMIGVPPVSETSIRDKVLSEYGEVKNFQAVDGLIYCEFDDRGPVDLCVEELNGFVLANRLIVVRALSDCLRAICFSAGIKMSPPVVAAQETVAAAVVDRDLYKETLDLATPLNKVLGGLPAMFSHLRPLFGTAMPVFPTSILVLLNAIDEQELLLDKDYSSLLADLSDELEQYGRVKRLIVPRRTPMPTPPKPFVPKKIDPPSRDVGLLNLVNPFDGSVATSDVPAAGSSAEMAQYEQAVREQEAEAAAYEEAKELYRRQRDEWDAEIRHPIHGGYGKAFVEYETVDEAAYAQRCICGKLFSGRTIVTSFMFEDVLYPPTIPEDAAEQRDQVEGDDHVVAEAAPQQAPEQLATEEID